MPNLHFFEHLALLGALFLVSQQSKENQNSKCYVLLSEIVTSAAKIYQLHRHRGTFCSFLSRCRLHYHRRGLKLFQKCCPAT